VGQVHPDQLGVLLQVLSVRPARREDAGPIAEIQLRGLPEAFAGHVPRELFDLRTLPDRRESWAGEIGAPASPRHGVLVAEIGGRVAGFVRFGPTRDDDTDPEITGEVMTIFTDQDRQGRGVGRALLGAAEAALRMSGFQAATLWMAVGNDRAQRFYKAAGWRLDGGRKLERVGKAQAPCVRYRIELATAPSGEPSP
jgi:ribosomal protein S18 acetylase RimI-like enzyme